MFDHVAHALTENKRAVERAATTLKGRSTIQWEREWDEGLDADAMGDLLWDTLKSGSPSGSLMDHGIGAYEFWGARGYDSQYGYEIEDASTVICLKGIGHEVPLPEKIVIGYEGGGCDGEHGGRCRAYCHEWEVDVAWTGVYQELRGEDLYIVLDGTQA